MKSVGETFITQPQQHSFLHFFHEFITIYNIYTYNIILYVYIIYLFVYLLEIGFGPLGTSWASPSNLTFRLRFEDEDEEGEAGKVDVSPITFLVFKLFIEDDDAKERSCLLGFSR